MQQAGEAGCPASGRGGSGLGSGPWDLGALFICISVPGAIFPLYISSKVFYMFLKKN